MLCEQIMNRNVKSLKEQDTALTAARVMRDANIGFLPVIGGGGKVVGTLTDRDLVVRLAADGGALTTPVTGVMSREVVTCNPRDDLHRAEQLMQDHRKSRIICVDEQGHAVGVISLSDIAQHEDGSQLGKLVRSITKREAHKA